MKASKRQKTIRLEWGPPEMLIAASGLIFLLAVLRLLVS